MVSDGEVLENVDDIITYLHTNYQNKITLDLLASKFNSNRTTLNERFYKATNLSIINYLIDYRINLASTFLRDTLIPISEIIERVGFNDIAHFGRTFKKHTGMSPSKYRNKYCSVGKCNNNENF
jgi:AraC family L-rhamnose operon regulatory protein RhaS